MFRQSERDYRTATEESVSGRSCVAQGRDGQSGHYIERIFDGPSENFNHLAQNGNFNTGAYRSLERRWDGLWQSGDRVDVRITPRYDGDSHRPSGLTVHSWVDGIRQDPITFNNSSGGR